MISTHFLEILMHQFSLSYAEYHPAFLALPMLTKATFVNAQERKDVWKPSKPCHAGIH